MKEAVSFGRGSGHGDPHSVFGRGRYAKDVFVLSRFGERIVFIAPAKAMQDGKFTQAVKAHFSCVSFL